jgi:hypothetical protein
MIQITREAAQGDVYVRRVDNIPASAKRVEAVGGRLIVAHSETGHHHSLQATPGAEQWADPARPGVCYLRLEAPLALEHQRDWAQHAPLMLGAGSWQIIRQREMTPEGWRQVQD